MRLSGHLSDPARGADYLPHYNRSERLAGRKKLMQAWADYLDGLRKGAMVTTLHGKA